MARFANNIVHDHWCLLSFCFLFLITIGKAQGANDLLVRFQFDSNPNPISIRIENQTGIKDIHFNAKDKCFPVVASIPDIGNPANNFIVIIPWKECDHPIHFSVKSTREGNEFDIKCQLKQLRPKISSLRILEQMTSSLKEKIERYLWSRDLFRRSAILLHDNHIVTIGALRQWFDASVKLTETEHDIFGLDKEAKTTMDKYRQKYGNTVAFRAVNAKTWYATGMALQTELIEWKGVAKVSELLKLGQFSDAYKLNEHYINLWATQNEQTRESIVHYWGVNSQLLENNRAYLNTLK